VIESSLSPGAEKNQLIFAKKSAARYEFPQREAMLTYYTPILQQHLLTMRGLLAAVAAAALASAAYDDSEGNAFAYLSAAAYCDAGPVDSWSCAACTQGPISLSSVDFIQDSEQTTFGYSGLDSSGVAYFAWRGSADIEMWINNLKFDTTPFPGCSGERC